MNSTDISCVLQAIPIMVKIGEIVYPIVVAAILIFNLTILFAIKNSNLKHSLTSILLTKLSLSCIILVPFHLMEWSTSIKDDWYYGAAACYFHGFITEFIMVSTAYTLLSIAYNRFSAISQPENYIIYPSKASILKNISVIWCLSAVTSSLLTICSKIITNSCGKRSCTRLYYGETVAGLMFLIQLIFGYVFPIVALVIVYVFINIKIAERNKNIIWENSALNETTITSPNKLLKPASSGSNVTNKIWKTSVGAISVFIITWSPFVILRFIKNWKPNFIIDPTIYGFTKFLISLYPLINPLMYALTNHSLRISIKKLYKNMLFCYRK